jgi:ABC-2 type transport system ATP-binding protein
MNEHENAIEITDLSKSFGKTPAVQGLSMKVAPGRVVGFLGPNGAGKTTTIKMLIDLLRGDAGSISVLGLDPAIQATQVRARVGYVPEKHSVPRWMRTTDALHFCRTFYPTWDNELCEKLMRLFALDPEKKVQTLSKGTQVKLALLLALAHRPELLILDEPMAGLDPLIREELIDGMLQTDGDRPRSILFSSHTFADVQRLADEVAIIHEGRLLTQCSIDVLLAKTKRIRAVLTDGASPKKTPEGTIWQRQSGREWLVTVGEFSQDTIERIRGGNQLKNIEVLDLSLEDIFKDFIRGQRSQLCI